MYVCMCGGCMLLGDRKRFLLVRWCGELTGFVALLQVTRSEIHFRTIVV